MTTYQYNPIPYRNAPSPRPITYDAATRAEVDIIAGTIDGRAAVSRIEALNARRAELVARYVYTRSVWRARLTLWRLRRCEARLNQALLIRQAQLGLLPPAPEGVALMERPLDDHLGDCSNR